MKFLDLFAGIGGFRLGMEMAGHECVGHCEIDKFANKSYLAMHRPKEGEWYAADIRRISPGDLPEAEVYCFGFPCQAFSIAGKRGGFTDTRGTLFFEVMRLVKERKPNILFAENVKGLLSHDSGRTFGTIIRAMDELGYDVEWQIFDSQHFGVPQHRERVFIVGHLRGTCGRKVFPITQDGRETDGIPKQTVNTITTRTGQGDTVGTYVVENKQYNQIKQIIGGSQGHRIYGPTGVSITLSSQGGGTGNTTGLYAVPVLTPDRINKRQNGRRFKEPNDPMFTLTGQDRHGVMIKDYKIRKLTPKECFRLQGFPDEYFERAASVNSDSQLYKQAGNSVTVNVIYEIARKL